MNDISHAMEQINKRLQKSSDPFGDIPKDHVCVIHPRHQRFLNEELMKMKFGYIYNFHQLTGGRTVFFDSRAEQNKFYFMSLTTYGKLFPGIPKLNFPDGFGNQAGEISVCGNCTWYTTSLSRCGIAPDVELVDDEADIFGCSEFVASIAEAE